MPDVEKILKMVEQGALTADEADQILATLSTDRPHSADTSTGAGWANRETAGTRCSHPTSRAGSGTSP